MTINRISMSVTLVGTIIVSVAIGISAYYKTLNAQDDKLSGVKETVMVHETRLNSINATLVSQDERQTRVENKIDALLIRQGINPLKYQ